MVASQEDTYV